MRAIVVDRPGGPEVMRLVEMPTPEPGPGEVRVRATAIGVNFADILCRRATHRSMRPPPIVPGCEVAGTIDACGVGVSSRRLGERVGVYSPFGGGYADALVVPSDYALPLPSTMEDDAAAALTHVMLTAHAALVRLCGARAGQTLLVTAAAGGLGTAVVQLARALGLVVIAAAGSAEKCARLAAAGHRAIDYGRPDWAARAREHGGERGIDLIVETVGGALFDEAQGLLAPLGTIVIAGAASGAFGRPDPAVLIDRSARCAALNLSVVYAQDPRGMAVAWTTLVAMHRDGAFQPAIGARYALADVAEAHRALESRATIGKLLIVP